MGWVQVDPDSEFMQRIAHVTQAKLRLHADSWMYWLPLTPAKALMGELSGLVQENLSQPWRSREFIQGGLVKAALGGYASSLLQVSFARCFEGLSEAEIDRILQSFSLRSCRPNQELVDLLSGYMRLPSSALESDGKGREG